MAAQAPTNQFGDDVLHGDGHSKLSKEEIAKAIARHQREHPGKQTKNPPAKPQKSKPGR